MTTADDKALHPAVGQDAVDEAFAVVKRARKALLSGKGVSKETALDYQAKADLILNEMDTREGGTVQAILARYASVSKSFHAMRSALVWHFAEVTRNLLREQDKLQRRESQSAEWLKAVDDVKRSLGVIDMIKSVRVEEMLAITGQQRKVKHSKRKDLMKLPKDWEPRMLKKAAGSPKYYLPTLVMAATGCRPAELVKGVKLRFGDGHVVARVLGSKVSEASGQKWRQFKFEPGALPVEVIEQIKAADSLEVSIESTDAFRTHLTRHSEELFRGKPAVTGYSFRHSVAEDLREAGWEAEEIGAVLGQAVSETQAYYGRRRRAGSRAPKAVGIKRDSVETARPVRPLNRSGLEAVVKSKSSTKARHSKTPGQS